jgi:hypothetical protein
MRGDFGKQEGDLEGTGGAAQGNEGGLWGFILGGRMGLSENSSKEELVMFEDYKHSKSSKQTLEIFKKEPEKQFQFYLQMF